MDFDDQLRRYFGTADPATLNPDALAEGTERSASISASSAIATAASRSGHCSTSSAARPISTWRSRTRLTAKRRATSWI